MVACARTSQGQTTVGDFVMVQLYIVQLFAPLANLGGSYRMMMQANPNHAHAMHIPRTSHAHAMLLAPSSQRMMMQAAIDVEKMGRSYGYLVITPTRRPSTWRRWAAAMVT